MQVRRGAAYLLLLATISAMAVVTGASLAMGHGLARRGAEQELLYLGEEFRRALLSWRAGGADGPRELHELLRDPRTAGVARHLRQVPLDPLTGQHGWGLVREPAGQIVGVYSLAPGKPLKRAGFDPVTQPGFEDADAYSRWVFGTAQGIAIER